MVVFAVIATDTALPAVYCPTPLFDEGGGPRASQLLSCLAVRHGDLDLMVADDGVS
jgi:hypothetical protein